jgi:hypothetical protein
MNARVGEDFGRSNVESGARVTSARPGGWLPCAARDHGEEGIAEQIGEAVPPGHRTPGRAASGVRGTGLILFLTNLLAIALAGQCFLYPLLLTWLQVKRVTLHFLDNVFSLNFALEAAQCVLERLALLNTDLCQGKYTSKRSQLGSAIRIRPWGAKVRGKSRIPSVTCTGNGTNGGDGNPERD